MALQKIRVLIVDDFADTRESIAKLLYFERDIEVAGSASDGIEGIRVAKELRPDVILMDINMPGLDGIAATERISAEVPESQVIMMSVQGEADFLRRAMLAGAREYLVKPFTGDELAGSIRHVYELSAEKRARLAAAAGAQPATAGAAPRPVPPPSGKIISVFSPKGGVGRTTVATNLAIGIRMLTDRRVALVDGNLLFGDIGIMLNLPSKKTISDLAPNIHNLDQELLDNVLVAHSSGVSVLLAPPRPELAELLTGDHLRILLTLLKSYFDYIVVDTFGSFEDTVLSMLDLSDQILALTTLEMPAIKNTKLFLEVAEALHYPREKLMLVLNRSDSTGGIQVEDIELSIRFKVSASIVSAGQLMTAAVNQGVPVVTSHPESLVARNLLELARMVMLESDAREALKRMPATAATSREPQPRLGLGRLRLPSFAPLAARKGGD